MCLVRWGLLVLVPVLVLLDPAHRLDAGRIFEFVLVAGGYNLVVTALLVLRLFPLAIPGFTLVADVAIAFVLLLLTREAPDLFFFFPLFPILAAALRFGWQLGLLTAGALAVGHGLAAVLATQPDVSVARLFQAGVYALLDGLAAVVPLALYWHPTPSDREDPPTAGPVKVEIPDHLKMIYEMAAALSATLNYERVLDSILDISHLELADMNERMGQAVGLVFLFDRDGLAPASYRNLPARGDDTRRIAGREGIVSQAIALGHAVVGGSPSEDPELSAFMSMHDCCSMICVPLRAGFETYGVLLFASPNANAFTTEHVDLLTIFCNQATIALQNASLYRTLRQERDKIVDKEEQARRKLARDLHDGPTQDVAAIAMRLNFARMLLDRDVGRARAELERLEDLAHRTVKEIRAMLFTLRPVILETEGLVAALKQYAENVRQNDNLPVILDTERYRDCLDTDAQGVVFSIIEEAVNNAKKHARASRVCVRMSVQNDLFVAHIEDNGRGFDVHSVEQNYGSRGSLGMLNLKERALLVEGTINIESTPGQGTRITLLVPIPEELS